MPNTILAYYVFLGPPLGGVIFLLFIMHSGVLEALAAGVLFAPISYFVGGIPALITGLYPHYCLKKKTTPNILLLLCLGATISALCHVFRFVSDKPKANITSDIVGTTLEQTFIGFVVTALIYALTKKKMDKYILQAN